MMRQVANRSRLLLDASSRLTSVAALRTTEGYAAAATCDASGMTKLQSLGNLFQRGLASGGAASSADPAAPGGTGEASADSSQARGVDDSSPEFEETAGEAALDNTTLHAIIDEQSAAAEKQQAQIKEMDDRLLRTLADMQNLRDRSERQIATNKQFAVQSFAKNLLDVADSLERAVEAVPFEDLKLSSKTNSAADVIKHLQTLMEGVRLTDKQLKSALRSSGVEKYEALGEKFDPNVHSALFEMPDPSKESGIVGVVTKSGYMLNDKVLRAAEVGVVRNA